MCGRKQVKNGVMDYLCVDQYLSGILEVQSLKTAFSSGLIDQLGDNGSVAVRDLRRSTGIDADGLAILIELLISNCVVQLNDDQVKLSTGFTAALAFRDLLETKIEFANFIAPDLLDNFYDYINNIEAFMERSRIFELFSYHRCYELTEENLSATGKWVRYTTVLTRYEAPACFRQFDISPFQSMLDIGGNSGEFALQACRINHRLSATVLDLPVVCEVGRRHVCKEEGVDRINFHEADALADEMPAGFNLISFKSMLHDWPDQAVAILLSKAAGSLAENGVILIFERSRLSSFKRHTGFGNLPLFMFMRFYRDPEFYKSILENCGFNDIDIKIIQLEMPFMLISAKKK